MDKKKLEKKLAKYKNKVNHAVIETLEKLHEEKEKFQKRFDQVKIDKEEVNDLLVQLHSYRSQKLDASYSQIGKHFEEIFSELVPGGKGTVRLETEDVMSTDSSSMSPRGDAIDVEQKYIGISIDVSFEGKDNYQEMSSLSGGQKTVVSLALIFAIQKVCEAPFYVFDEADAALDSKRREAVASYIHSFLKNTPGTGIIRSKKQFISTTFRKELLSSADRFIGVTFHQGISNAKIIDYEAAKDFITHRPPVTSNEQDISTSSP